MSESNPTYSSNPILDAVEHVGHGLHVVFSDAETVVAKLPEYITVTEDLATEAPTVVSDITAVVTAITGGASIFNAVTAALAGLGTNPTADIAAITAIITQASKMDSYWASVKSTVTTLLTTLGADEKTIAAVFETPAPAPTTTATN
jgi:hypothetical protein